MHQSFSSNIWCRILNWWTIYNKDCSYGASVINELGCTNTDKDKDTGMGMGMGTGMGTGIIQRHEQFLYGTPNEVSVHPTKGTQRVTTMI